jgi:hypothetical protein
VSEPTTVWLVTERCLCCGAEHEWREFPTENEAVAYQTERLAKVEGRNRVEVALAIDCDYEEFA